MRQSIVDELVDDVAFSLGIGRHSLNIVAACKGLLSGSLRLRMADSGILDFSSSPGVLSVLHGHVRWMLTTKLQGALIPPTQGMVQADFGLTRWILVIEKEVLWFPVLRHGSC